MYLTNVPDRATVRPCDHPEQGFGQRRRRNTLSDPEARLMYPPLRDWRSCTITSQLRQVRDLLHEDDELLQVAVLPSRRLQPSFAAVFHGRRHSSTNLEHTGLIPHRGRTFLGPYGHLWPDLNLSERCSQAAKVLPPAVVLSVLRLLCNGLPTRGR